MSDTPVEKHPGLPCTFPVDDVVPVDSPIWTEPLGDHVTKKFLRNVLFLPDSKKEVINYQRDYMLSRRQLSGPLSPEFEATMKQAVNRYHPLIEAVETAFSQHRPLTISPDSIWLVIQQGFAHHIAENAEALRHRLVRHDGSRELTTTLLDFSQFSLENAVSSFSSQIREHSDPFLHDNLLCDFSTTTPAIRTASEVVLMDCYSSYFTYGMALVCGIPKITVTGTLSDWQRIRDRVELLETFDLGWWTKRLRPILDEFLLTIQGRVTAEFWQAIYKPKKAYGDNTVTGWIADLFPYLNDAPERRRNLILEFDRDGWAVPVEKGVKLGLGYFEPGADRGVSGKSFPSGLASVRVNLKLPNSSTHAVDLVAGFLAVEQDPSDLALSPVIGWSLTERRPAKPVLL